MTTVLYPTYNVPVCELEDYNIKLIIILHLYLHLLALLQDFLSAIFDTLLYQLNDALSRLGKVKRYETDKEGE